MKTIIVAGAKGSGKTTLVKYIAKTQIGLKNTLVYDVNGEYKEEGFTSTFPSIEDFLTRAGEVRNTTIVFEEATIFFSSKGRSEKLINILVRARHNKNFIILVFHSIRSIPMYVYELTEYVFLKNTNDPEHIVEKKFGDQEEFITLFQEVQQGAIADKYFWGKMATGR